VSLPSVGSSAPQFSTTDDADRPFKLSQHRGKWIVLFFYPKDDTPG
jgi:peroxiredoxin Q/BCP